MTKFRKLTALILSLLIAVSLPMGMVFAAEDEAQQQAVEPPLIAYSAHVANIGWMDPVRDGNIAGTVGKGYQMEALRIWHYNLPEGSDVEFQAHCQNEGWQGYRAAGADAGTTGRGLSLQAIQIRLTGPAQQLYDIYYRMHVSNYGWLDWACNDGIAGTTGLDCPAEAIEIRILPKGAEAPGSTTTPYLNMYELLKRQ